MNMVFVLDKETFEPKWHWGSDELQKQHDPEQIDNGNLLVFDNGKQRHYSRVLELDPTTKKIVWEYKDEDFFSNIRGLSQRLPNGGTLVVSSQRGRAFEVTTEGEIVWEYWSPDVLGGKLRVPLRMERLQGDALAFAQKQIDEGKGNPDGASKPKRGGPSRTSAEGEGAPADADAKEAEAKPAAEEKADDAKPEAKADAEKPAADEKAAEAQAD